MIAVQSLILRRWETIVSVRDAVATAPICNGSRVGRGWEIGPRCRGPKSPVNVGLPWDRKGRSVQTGRPFSFSPVVIPGCATELGFTRVRQYHRPSRQQPTWMRSPESITPNRGYGFRARVIGPRLRAP